MEVRGYKHDVHFISYFHLEDLGVFVFVCCNSERNDILSLVSLLKLKVKLDHTREFVQLRVWRRVDRVSTGVVLYYFLGRPLREPVKTY